MLFSIRNRLNDEYIFECLLICSHFLFELITRAYEEESSEEREIVLLQIYLTMANLNYLFPETMWVEHFILLTSESILFYSYFERYILYSPTKIMHVNIERELFQLHEALLQSHFLVSDRGLILAYIVCLANLPQIERIFEKHSKPPVTPDSPPIKYQIESMILFKQKMGQIFQLFQN